MKIAAKLPLLESQTLSFEASRRWCEGINSSPKKGGSRVDKRYKEAVQVLLLLTLFSADNEGQNLGHCTSDLRQVTENKMIIVLVLRDDLEVKLRQPKISHDSYSHRE